MNAVNHGKEVLIFQKLIDAKNRVTAAVPSLPTFLGLLFSRYRGDLEGRFDWTVTAAGGRE